MIMIMDAQVMDVFLAIQKHGRNVRQMIDVLADGLVIPVLLIVPEMIQAADVLLARIATRKTVA